MASGALFGDCRRQAGEICRHLYEMGGHNEGPMMSGGVRVFSIGGRLVYERERMQGMTTEERRWRAQFLKDQVLEPTEPRFCPELYKATNNIFVRLGKIPMNLVQKAVTPIFGENRARSFRYVTSRLIATYFGLMCITYCLKYNMEDWTRDGGWIYSSSKERRLPGDPTSPKTFKNKQEYADCGFSKSIFA